MAAVDIEDDETWLYGDSEGKENKGDKTQQGENNDEDTKNSQLSANAAPFNPKTSGDNENGEDKEAGELSGEEDGGSKKEAVQEEEEEEDSDDDDDVQITIGDIKTAPSYESRSIFKGTTTYQKPVATAQTPKIQQTKGVDLETVGTVNGVPVFEFDLDNLQAEECPWRKPGADITDYFNYGFNEDTWRQYCEKQRRQRMENNSSGKLFIPSASSTTMSMKASTPKTAGTTTVTSTDTTDPASPGFNRKAGPPPGRKMSGTIDVIGSTSRDSRRPTMQYENPYEQDNRDFKKPYVIGSTPGIPPPHGVPPPHITPDFGVPPPGPVPPPGMPPQMVPPPGVPPPPGVSVPPPGFPPPSERYDPYYAPSSGMPPDRPPFDERPPYGYDDPYRGPPPPYGGPPMAPPWEARPIGGFGPGWDYGREGPPRSDSDFSSSEDERVSNRYDYRGRDTYDRDRDRSYRRERPERSERSRSRDRDRDRERRHRDREDRHKRRKHRDAEEDSEHRSSRHKKSKRSRKEKEDEAPEPSTAQNEESSK